MSQLRVELPPEVPVEEARLLLAIKLFETRRLWLGQAARLARYSRRAFLEIPAKAGVPVFDDPSKELQDELGA